MFRDLKCTIRSLSRQPLFSGIAVLTLALGIGVTSAVFSIVYGALLKPPPYQKPQQLVLITPARTDGRPVAHAQGWASLQWLGWQRTAKSLQAIAAYDWTFNYLIRDDGSESMEGLAVTRDYFRVTGQKPLIGRTFSDDETAFPTKPVVVLGYEFWQRKLNGDPNIVGKKVYISREDTPPEVIGVMPPGIRFLPAPTTAEEPNYNANAHVDFWTPAAPNPDARAMKALRWNVVARLSDGATLAQAGAELASLTAVQEREEKDLAGMAPHLEPLRAELNREGDRILYPLLGAAALVLLIACGNAMSLMLVRGLQRQQEYAVRSALGVSRYALVWQASAENLTLALAGGILGIGVASAIRAALKSIGGHAIPRIDAAESMWPVIACGFGIALLSAVAAGFLPALRANRLNAADVLKSAGPKSSTGRQERGLLHTVAIAQISLTLALLMGAGLLIRTMRNLSQVTPGYETAHILTMSVTAVRGNTLDFHRRALDQLTHVAGVEHAAFAWGVPLTGNNWPGTADIEGQPKARRESDKPSFPVRSVTEDYFPLMGVPLLDGRNVRASDVKNAPPVAVVNQAFVQRYFPYGHAIGKRVWLFGPSRPPVVIVGVAANGRNDDLTRAPQPELYLSLWQMTPFSKHLLLRTSYDPKAIANAVRTGLRRLDPTVAVENIKTMGEIRSDSLATRNFATSLLTGFSAIGTLLMLIGVYGLLALSVASRRRELAIRTAVGARESDIRGLVFAQGFRLAAAGLVCGLVAAFVLASVLRSFFYGVTATDPLTLAGVLLSLAAVILMACWIPSRRAARISPMEALRYE